jgi:hypothetical protein
MASILSYALTDLASVKESLRIPSSTTTYDNLIIRKINQATRAIEAYCGRRFKATTFTEVEYTGTVIDQIILRQRPIIEFTALEVRNTTLNSSDWETIDTQLYFVDYAAGILDLNFIATGKWNRYRVSYTAGYYTIPEDLAEACATLAAFYYNNADGSDVGVSRKKEGQREIHFALAGQTFKSVLEALGIDEILYYYANFPLMTDR